MPSKNFGRKGRGPDRTTLERWLRQGMTQQQIADRWMSETGYHCARSTVAESIKRWGLKSANPRSRYETFIPWKVKAEHGNHYHLRMLRALARRSQNGLDDHDENVRLDGWLRKLRDLNAVVHYDPSRERGFGLVPRKESDGDDIIRRP